MIKKLILLFLLFPLVSFGADGLTASPTIVDRTAYLRDDFTFQISVENNGEKKARFYPVVANNWPDKGEKFSDEEGFSSWASVDRGRMEVGSGGEKIIDVSVDIPGDADPGTYYGKVFFGSGSSRGGAENYAKENKTPHLFVRLKVKENTVENAELNKFTTEKSINLSGNVDLSTQIKSIGNSEITPTGEILIYEQRSGREVGALDLNSEETVINPEEAEQFKNSWKGGFGSYRAELRAEYGDEAVRDIQSTTHFKIIPYPFVIGFLLLIIILTTTVIILVKRLVEQAA